ncbi:MAG: hypothetical protein EOO03_12745 [Chitinophagaceae bacterium]|nr:MAG: hypothetical protein EOO03_12745 [Chitinophagaceae bacterium]
MLTPQPIPLLQIVLRYSDPLERYARRLITAKHRAPDIVKWAMEEAYEEQQFFEGPHLRPLLINKTKKFCLGLNKAIQIAATYRHPLDNSQSATKYK